MYISPHHLHCILGKQKMSHKCCRMWTIFNIFVLSTNIILIVKVPIKLEFILPLQNRSIICSTLNRLFDFELKMRGGKWATWQEQIPVTNSPKLYIQSIVCSRINKKLWGTDLLAKKSRIYHEQTFRCVGKYISYLYVCQRGELREQGYANLHILRHGIELPTSELFLAPSPIPNKYLRWAKHSREDLGVLSAL